MIQSRSISILNEMYVRCGARGRAERLQLPHSEDPSLSLSLAVGFSIHYGLTD